MEITLTLNRPVLKSQFDHVPKVLVRECPEASIVMVALAASYASRKCGLRGTAFMRPIWRCHSRRAWSQSHLEHGSSSSISPTLTASEEVTLDWRHICTGANSDRIVHFNSKIPSIFIIIAALTFNTECCFLA